MPLFSMLLTGTGPAQGDSGFAPLACAARTRAALPAGLAALAFALVAAVGGSMARADDLPLVAVTAIVEHPALDAARDGVKAALKDAGFEDGKNIRFVYESAQGNPATAVQIARKFVGEEPAVIVPIATPSAQAVASATKDIPVVFIAVSDPVGAGLVQSLGKPGGNITGVSDFSPIGDQVALIKEITPAVKTIGVIYNPGEANSVSLVEAFRGTAEDNGFKVVESTANTSAAVQQAARALVGKADAIYVPTDNTVISALESAVKVAEEAKIPLYTADTDSVARGAIAAIGFNYFDVGKEAGVMVADILGGQKPSKIPAVVAKGTNLVVNPGAAARYGVTIPEAVVAKATTVVK